MRRRDSRLCPVPIEVESDQDDVKDDGNDSDSVTSQLRGDEATGTASDGEDFSDQEQDNDLEPSAVRARFENEVRYSYWTFLVTIF